MEGSSKRGIKDMEGLSKCGIKGKRIERSKGKRVKNLLLHNHWVNFNQFGTRHL